MFNFISWLHSDSNDFIKQYREQNQDINSVYNDMLHYIKKTVDYDSASLLILSKNNTKFKTVAQQGDGCNLIKGMHFKMGIGLSAWLAQKNKVICLPNIHRGARHGHNPIRSFVAIPIKHNNSVIGIINLAHVRPNAYGPREVKTLQNLAQSLAPQIDDMVSTITKGN